MTDQTTSLPAPGEIWCHSKTGGRYEIVDLGYDSRDGDMVVIYRAKGGVWVRPVSQFLGFNEDKQPRFWKEKDAAHAR